MKKSVLFFVILCFLLILFSGCNLFIGIFDNLSNSDFLEIKPNSVEIEIRSYIYLSAVYYEQRGSSGTDVTDTVSWYSEDPAIASVDPDGYVSAYSPGNTNIIAEYEDLKAVCSVFVYDPGQVTPEGEMIINGDFSNYDLDWVVYFSDALGDYDATSQEMYIYIETPGTDPWSVQLLQSAFPIEQGTEYYISFDARAESPRDIDVTISQAYDPYTTYSDTFTFTLSTEMQRYYADFTMSYPTDPSCRIEFNMGLDTSDVWLDNISLAPNPATTSTPSPEPSPTPEGELIYNGDFYSGSENWMMNYYETGTGAQDTTGEEFHAIITNGGTEIWHVQLIQEFFNLSSSMIYHLQFDARADASRTMEIDINQAYDPYSTYSGRRLCNLTTSMQTFEYDFQMIYPTDSDVRIEFNMGLDLNDVYIDNVSLMPSAAAGPELIENRDISDGSSYWTLMKYNSASATLDVSNPELHTVIISPGSMESDIQLVQEHANLNLENGIPYRLVFNARAAAERYIYVNLREINPPNDSFSGIFTCHLTTTYQTFIFEFTGGVAPTGPARLEFNLGFEMGDVYIDDLNLMRLY
jgi:hypothetical protein